LQPVVSNGLVYVASLMTQWVFNRGVEEQMKAFLDGFSEVLPLQWLQYFDERELEVRLFILLIIINEASSIVKCSVYRKMDIGRVLINFSFIDCFDAE